jgi:uncharacterized membrane protein YhaH (DUF805 family)
MLERIVAATGVAGGTQGNGGSTAGNAIVFVIVMLAGVSLGLVSFALLIRLLHDTGKSGWWMLLGLIPLAGPLMVLLATLTPGTREPNQYQP